MELPKSWRGDNFLNPENQSFENVLIVTFKYIFDIPLLNNLFIFLNLFISLTELKTLLNNVFIFLNIFISLIELKTFLNNLFIFLNIFISLIELKTLLNSLFCSYFNLFIAEHPLRKNIWNFKIGKITYWKSQSITT